MAMCSHVDCGSLKQADFIRLIAEQEICSHLSSSFTFQLKYCLLRGPGSSVGLPTGYGRDGPGIESRWGQDFPHLSRPALEPNQPPVKWVPGLSRGKRAAGA